MTDHIPYSQRMQDKKDKIDQMLERIELVSPELGLLIKQNYETGSDYGIEKAEAFISLINMGFLGGFVDLIER